MKNQRRKDSSGYKMVLKKQFGRMFALNSKDEIIKNQTKRKDNIVYGGRSLKKQLGFLSRSTNDWDIISTKPRMDAVEVERKLDKIAGYNQFYSRQSDFHKGTYKVIDKGPDYRRGTKDDVGIVDYSTPDRKLKTRRIDGIRYTKLSETVKDKKKAIADPQFEFRKKKDQEDLIRINFGRKVMRVLNKK